VSDGAIGLLVGAVLVALLFFTPRRPRGSRVSYPAGPGTKAIGVFLLLMLALAAALGFVRDTLLHGGR
jgi:hypothetical protein